MATLAPGATYVDPNKVFDIGNGYTSTAPYGVGPNGLPVDSTGTIGTLYGGGTYTIAVPQNYANVNPPAAAITADTVGGDGLTVAQRDQALANASGSQVGNMMPQNTTQPQSTTPSSNVSYDTSGNMPTDSKYKSAAQSEAESPYGPGGASITPEEQYTINQNPYTGTRPVVATTTPEPLPEFNTIIYEGGPPKTAEQKAADIVAGSLNYGANQPGIGLPTYTTVPEATGGVSYSKPVIDNTYLPISSGFAEPPKYNESGAMLASFANSQQVSNQGLVIPSANDFAQGSINAFTSITNFLTGASKPLANTSLNTTPLAIPSVQSDPTIKSLPVLAPTAAYESVILSTPITPPSSFAQMSYYSPINVASSPTPSSSKSALPIPSSSYVEPIYNNIPTYTPSIPTSTPSIPTSTPSTSSQLSSSIPSYISDQYNKPSPIPEAVVNIPTFNTSLPTSSSTPSTSIPKETIVTASKTFDVTPKLSSSYISDQYNKPSPIPTAVVNISNPFISSSSIPQMKITTSPFANRVIQQPIVNQVKRIQSIVKSNPYTMIQQPQNINIPSANMNMSLFDNRENVNNIKQNVKNKVNDIFKNMENIGVINKKKRR